MLYVPRALGRTLRRAIRTFPAALLTGARQSGKTTFLRHELAETHRYVSLERPDVRLRASADPIAFLGENPPPVILDEIQSLPTLLHYVKERIDEDRRPGQWVLSGSQSFALMRGIRQTLAGRIAILTLDPLSALEASGAKPQPSLDAVLARVFGKPTAPRRPAGPAAKRVDLADWLLRGGYPEPRIHPKVDREIWFASYVQTYLERDVRDLLRVGDLAGFGRFVALAATRTGNLLNVNELAREAGVSGPTAKKWLSVLQASHVVHLLTPYHRNLGKRIRKSPKLCFVDPGLATFLLGLHSRDALLHGTSLGPLVETAVVGEWLKAFRNFGLPPAIHFWRSSAGEEVDLVMEHEGRLYGIEVKATATPTPHHAEALARFISRAGPTARGVLACRVEAPVALRPGIRAVPWHLAW
jgi:hypothetical protein